MTMKQTAFPALSPVGIFLTILFPFFAVKSRADEAETFNHSGAVETFVVPEGVTSIHIEACGAQGGGSSGGTAGGRGARMTGTFEVTPGQVLSIVVGQQGLLQTGGNQQNSSGGGGGTFVYTGPGPTLLVAAGGGGGKCNYDGSEPLHAGADGQTTTSGGDSSDGNTGGSGGDGGPAGIWSSNPCSGGGTGWLSPGGGPFGGMGLATWTGGPGFGDGGGEGTGGVGGFGGGGGGGNLYGGGGGGGGYSGGAGGTDPTHGGGGGSYSIGTDQDNAAGFREGDGIVVITYSLGGVDPVSAARLSAPASLHFPATRVGRSSVNSSLAIRNTGDAVLGSLSARLIGGGRKDFQIITNPSASIGAGGSTVAGLSFAPQKEGNRRAFLLLRSDSGSLRVNLKGRGLRRQGTNSPRFPSL